MYIFINPSCVDCVVTSLQFTLMSVLKGNKPDFHNAMEAEKSKEFYDEFLAEMRKKFRPEAIKGIIASTV